MPTYEYRCENCQHEFEQLQSMKDNALVNCPECKKNSLRRLISSGAGIIFKGSGFYQTDYRSENYKKEKEKETTAKNPKKESNPKKKDQSTIK